jgi:hypothetical protein
LHKIVSARIQFVKRNLQTAGSSEGMPCQRSSPPFRSGLQTAEFRMPAFADGFDAFRETGTSV